MEYLIAVFLGLWVSVAGVISYFRLKKDFESDEKRTKETDDK